MGKHPESAWHFVAEEDLMINKGIFIVHIDTCLLIDVGC